jgi:hypothetical protein
MAGGIGAAMIGRFDRGMRAGAAPSNHCATLCYLEAAGSAPAPPLGGRAAPQTPLHVMFAA